LLRLRANEGVNAPKQQYHASAFNAVGGESLERLLKGAAAGASVLETSSRGERDGRRLAVTPAHAVFGVATKVVCFSLVAAVFIFVSMLLLTGLHP
jgi:hypothetical protein